MGKAENKLLHQRFGFCRESVNTYASDGLWLSQSIGECVKPGNVNGERMKRVINAHAETGGLDPDVVRRMYAIDASMQCYVDPEEIADTICFLCSDYGRRISGQVIGVDGNTETLFPRS